MSLNKQSNTDCLSDLYFPTLNIMIPVHHNNYPLCNDV